MVNRFPLVRYELTSVAMLISVSKFQVQNKDSPTGIQGIGTAESLLPNLMIAPFVFVYGMPGLVGCPSKYNDPSNIVLATLIYLLFSVFPPPVGTE